MLSLDQQKRLTEFLGKCWHNNIVEMLDCEKCTETLAAKRQRLDISDWRVVGRLIEKMADAKTRDIMSLSQYIAYNGYIDAIMKGDKLAICLAIDAYLVAKGETNAKP